MACPDEAPLYDRQSQNCVGCPAGTSYDEDERQCLLDDSAPVPNLKSFNQLAESEIINSKRSTSKIGKLDLLVLTGHEYAELSSNKQYLLHSIEVTYCNVETPQYEKVE